VSIATTAQRYPIRRAILVGLGGMVALGLVMLIGTSVYQLSTTSERSASAWRSYGLLDGIRTLQVAEERTRASVLAAAASGATDDIARIAAGENDMQAALRSLAAAVASDPLLAASLESAARSVSRWDDTWAAPIHDLLVTNPGTLGRTQLDLARGDAMFDAAAADSMALRAAASARMSATLASWDGQAQILVTGVAAGALGLCLGVLLIGRWLLRVVTGPLQRLNETAFAQINGEPVQFKAERDDEVGSLARVLERLRQSADDRYSGAREEAHRAATMNKLGDLIAFSSAEFEMIDGTVRALRRLVTTRRGDVQLTNASRNRLLFAGSWGPEPPGLDTPVPVEAIDLCPAIRRAAPFVVPDVDDDLAVLCAAHPQETGSLACVPLIAMGRPIGVIHLESDEAISDETVSVAVRIAEQVAVAIANARLMKTMEGLAMTDSLTGLRNARSFDAYLEHELAAAERDREPLSVLMIDIDHFKKFNDTHGHPAGDEALRVFGRVVRSILRASDVPARYGGEEFVVALRHTDGAAAVLVAEKLRAAVAQAIVEIGPARYGRFTISIGVAEADLTRIDQKSLLGDADGALYRAKSAGRDRVVLASSHLPQGALPDSTADSAQEAPRGRHGTTAPTRPPVPLQARRRRGAAARRGPDPDEPAVAAAG
jgi:diguanylate cyclase (GGDEF)-like protein